MSSHRKFTEQKIKLIKELIETHYYDFGPKFASEKLYELHKINVSKETLRQWMIEWGLWQSKSKKTVQLHPLRDRRPCFGELVQIDGSPPPVSG